MNDVYNQTTLFNLRRWDSKK